MGSLLHFPYEGSLLDQPAKVIELFHKIQYYNMKSMDDEDEGVSEPDPQQEAQEFEERMARLKGNN